MTTPTRAHPTRAQIILGAAALLSYGVGYPIALLVHSAIGWAFVTVGGIFLLALGVVTVRHIDSGARNTQ